MSIQLMQRRMTRTSGGVEQIQTMQMGGKLACVFGLSQMPKHLAYSVVSSVNDLSISR